MLDPSTFAVIAAALADKKLANKKDQPRATSRLGHLRFLSETILCAIGVTVAIGVIVIALMLIR